MTSQPPIQIPLLPCPFCGGAAHVHHNADPETANGYFYAVCKSFKCCWGPDGVTEDDAAKLWNTRDGRTPDSSLIEAMEAASWPIATPADSQGCMRVVALADAVAIVRQKQAEQDDAVGTLNALLENEQALRRAVEQQFTIPDGRPIFGEGSPHDIGEHLDRVCASEIRGVVDDDLRQAWGRIQHAMEFYASVGLYRIIFSGEPGGIAKHEDVGYLAANCTGDVKAVDKFMRTHKPVSLVQCIAAYAMAAEKKPGAEVDFNGVKAVLATAGVPYAD